MIIIDGDRKIVGLGTTEIKDPDGKIMTIGISLANLVLSSRTNKKFDPFKAWKMAERFYKGGNIEIDEGDFNNLKELVNNGGREVYNDLVLGQIMDEFIQKTPA